MIVMVVVDDRNGMMFHGRRQSRDRMLRAKILELASGCKLWMNAFSRAQFTEEEVCVAEDSLEQTGLGESPRPQVCVAEDFLQQAGPGEYCFVEDCDPAPYGNRIEELIRFRWNRSYPGDVFLGIDLEDGSWGCMETEEFPGYSHERITMERFVKRNMSEVLL